MFQTTEYGSCPWNVTKDTVYDSVRAGEAIRGSEGQSGVSLTNWIGLWVKNFNTDPKTAFRDLVYVGYNGQLKDAIIPIYFRPRDVQGVPS